MLDRACYFAPCANTPYREDSGKTCSLQVLDLVESEEGCQQPCSSDSVGSGACQSCIEDQLTAANSSECLQLSSSGCFHCTRPVMLDSLQCSEDNTKPGDIVQCIHDRQEAGCQQCVCSVLCYVNAEGDLCRECLQNPDLATFFLNSGKCPQSWTWSQHTQRCYKAFNQTKPWAYASRFCEQGGGRLAQPKSDSTTFTVLEAINLEGGGMHWLGGQQSGEDFLWMGDNSVVDSSNWAPGFPVAG